MADLPKDNNDAEVLPVTTEVGSEGGSYTDAVVQTETLKGHLPRVDRVEPPQPPPGAVAGGVEGNPDDPDDGLRFQQPGPTAK